MRTRVRTDQSKDTITPRFGLVYRPLSVSTLGSVVQVGLTLDERTFITVKADYPCIHDPAAPGVDLRTPSLPFLQALRNPQSVNLSAVDVLEVTPKFEDGTEHAYAIGFNRLLTSSLSGNARYAVQNSSSDHADAAPCCCRACQYFCMGCSCIKKSGCRRCFPWRRFWLCTAAPCCWV